MTVYPVLYSYTLVSNSASVQAIATDVPGESYTACCRCLVECRSVECQKTVHEILMHNFLNILLLTITNVALNKTVMTMHEA